MNYSTKWANLFWIIITLFQTTSCKTLYDMNGYAKSSAKGSISGTDWAYTYAFTDPEAKLPNGQTILIILAANKPKHACPNPEDMVGDARNVAISIDGKIGEMKINGVTGALETSESQFTYTKADRQGSVAFQDPKLPEAQQYKFATSGKIKITKLTDSVVHGSFVAKINQDNYANGQFKAKLCKHGQLN
jgi:hypothetical protein